MHAWFHITARDRHANLKNHWLSTLTTEIVGKPEICRSKWVYQCSRPLLCCWVCCLSWRADRSKPVVRKSILMRFVMLWVFMHCYFLVSLSWSLVAVEISECVCIRKLVRSSLHAVQHFHFEVFGVLSSSGCRMWNKTYNVGSLYREGIRGLCKDIPCKTSVCTGVYREVTKNVNKQTFICRTNSKVLWPAS